MKRSYVFCPLVFVIDFQTFVAIVFFLVKNSKSSPTIIYLSYLEGCVHRKIGSQRKTTQQTRPNTSQTETIRFVTLRLFDKQALATYKSQNSIHCPLTCWDENWKMVMEDVIIFPN